MKADEALLVEARQQRSYLLCLLEWQIDQDLLVVRGRGHGIYDGGQQRLTEMEPVQPQRAAHRGEVAHQLAVETTLPPARNGPVEAGLMADGQTGFLPAPGGMGTEWLKIADHQIVIPAIQRSHVLPEAQRREPLEGTPARDAALMADETDAGEGAIVPELPHLEVAVGGAPAEQVVDLYPPALQGARQSPAAADMTVAGPLYPEQYPHPWLQPSAHRAQPPPSRAPATRSLR
ncbi:hypothetical protein D3C80_684660 [compost metagenome]